MRRVAETNPETSGFRTPAGRAGSLGEREPRERWPGDPLAYAEWAIFLEGTRAGTLYQGNDYGTAGAGEGRFHASLNQLRWDHSDIPTGLGFDVAAFDTAEETLAAWGRNADEILDWTAGKEVRSIYSKTGSFRRRSS